MDKLHVITSLLLLTATVVNTTKIIITSSSSFRNGDESLTIFCEVSSRLGLDKITNIHLERGSVFLGSIDENGTKMGWKKRSFSYEISGEFHPSSPTRSYLQLVIRNPSTEDQGTYECTTVGLEVKHITDTQRQYVRLEDSGSTISESSITERHVTCSAVSSWCVIYQTFQVFTLTGFLILCNNIVY